MLKRNFFVSIVVCLAAALALKAQSDARKKPSAPGRTAHSSAVKPGSIETRVEKYLRNLYAWGSSFEVKVGQSKPSPVPGLLEVPVTVSKGGQSDSAVVYVSQDGNFLIRGELSDMSADPFAEVRSKLHPEDSPSMGAADAQVTLVEFADLECPSCRQLDLFLKDYLPHHPETRLVFKHFPLTEIHPWAMTAALAAQCAFHQDPAAFWKMHDAIFDSQEGITPSNAWDKMIGLATQIGLNPEDLKTCMAAPETSDRIKADISQGRSLNITATPTTFVNGRRVVGPDNLLIDQYGSFP